MAITTTSKVYGITYINDLGKRQVIISDNQLCMFKDKATAAKYETEVLVPRLKSLYEHGVLSGTNWLGKKKYAPIPEQDRREIRRILETIMTLPVSDIKFGADK